MGGVAAAVTFRKEPSVPEKAVWIVLLTLLIVAEIRNLYVADAHQASIFGNIQHGLEVTASGLDATTRRVEESAQKEREQFEVTRLGIEKSIDTVTGGSTFSIVTASPIENEFVLFVTAKGNSPLHEVTTDMVDVDAMKAVTAGKHEITFEEIQSFTQTLPMLPFLSSTGGRILTRIPVGARTKRNLHFNFFSLNGLWSVILKLEFINGQWAQAEKVTKESEPIHGKRTTRVLYTFSTPTFPKDKGGRIDWDN
jgi:hypothetical protein